MAARRLKLATISSGEPQASGTRFFGRLPAIVVSNP